MNPSHPTAAVVVIGDEVLGGRVEEVNAAYLCRRLSELGMVVRRVVVVPDEVPEIAREVASCAAQYAYVLTSGGVGPTHDDVTMAGIAAAFDLPLKRNPAAETVIRNFYGDAMADAALAMADQPEGAELITREGMRFPVVKVNNVWIFPGSPHLMKAKFEAVKDRFAATPFAEVSLKLDTREPEIAPFLGTVQAAYPNVAIGSYPQEPGVPFRLLLTIKGDSTSVVEKVVAELREGLSGHLVPEEPD